MSPVTGGEGAIFGKLVHRLFEKLDWVSLVCLKRWQR